MDSLLATYGDDDDNDSSNTTTKTLDPTTNSSTPTPDTEPEPAPASPKFTKVSEEEDDDDDDEPENDDAEDDDDNGPPGPKKQKPLSSLPTDHQQPPPPQGIISPKTKRMSTLATTITTTTTIPNNKKSKKKGNNVWSYSTSRKGKKKTKNLIPQPAEENNKTVLVTPVPRFPDRTDDSPDLPIRLSKVHKAEKVELSDDRLSAGSTKGYRMVRATRGVMEGAWYFEIRVLALGPTGHTRLGWSTEKGDLQAPVGYDANSYGYRDVDGSKVHRALRVKYGEEGYGEGDVIGVYISLHEGGLYAPEMPRLVLHKGQRYAATDGIEDSPKVVPGSEISFFKNGICQGVAFQDLYGGRYYPAASMYTLPNQPNCVVKFNFGPDFDFFPEDFGDRPIPRPMIEVPYHEYDGKNENFVSSEKKH